jgi:ABC-type Fe3+/spermidine/putrescine transport system ATPase subunit
MLEITNLTRRFGDVTVLDSVSLAQSRGEVACIVGPSGCGKSTLLRLVAGLDAPDDGRIVIGHQLVSCGRSVVAPHKRSINMVFQDYALWPHMRVNRIVGYGLSRWNRPDREKRVSELLRLMRIETLADRLPSELSGGQQQRVAIARALATNPRILLLDEPLSNLDVQLRTEMRLEFAELFRSVEATVLYVTHDPLEASSFADRLIVMRKGQIEQEGEPETLFAKPSSEWAAMLAGYDVRLHLGSLRRDGEGLVADAGGHQVRIASPTGNLPLDTPVSLMLHPASIRFGEAATGCDNHLSGTVSNTLYEGRHWRVSLRVGADEFSLLAPFRCTAGDKIAFSFSSRDAVAFPVA